MNKDIYLTEQSLLELFQGKDIYEDDGKVIIHAPKTRMLIKEVIENGKSKIMPR